MGKNIGTIKYNNGGVYDDFFPRTVYGAITSSSDSATTLSDDLTSIKQKQETMKEKLDTVDRGANKYTHPSTSGNRHIPSGGSAGQVLKWSADGTAVWGSVEGKDGTIVNIVNREQTTQATNVNFIKNEIKQDSLSGLYDVSKNPNGNVLIDSVKSNNITLINAKIVDGKLTFPNNGNIKISNYINEDAFTIFLNLKDIKIKDIFFSIASFGSTCILVNQQNACAIMIEKNTNLVLLRTMYGLTSAKKLPYIEGWMAISYDGNSLTFANELGTVVTEIREFDKNNSYLFNSSVYDTAHVTLNDLILYDKNLTPTEILHNLSVLNSTPSICAIETTDSEGHKTRFSFSSDTDHITDRTGRTQEDINRTLYKKFCSKFTSNGEDIVIDNGLDGYMLSGKLEGHTVKNVLQPSDYNNKHLYSPGTFVDDYYIDGSKTRFNMFTIDDIKFEVGKEYTLSMEIVENTLKKDAWGGHMECIFNFNIKAGQVGVFHVKKTLKTSDKVSRIFYFNFAEDFDSSLEKIKYRFWVTENGYSDTFCTGLSSTKAIISNNGEKYPIYEPTIQGKTRIMKAPKGTQNWVEISAIEPRDTSACDYKLESIAGLYSVPNVADYIDIARKVKVVHTKEVVLNGSEDWKPWNNREDKYGCYLNIPDSLPNQQGNGFCDKLSVYQSLLYDWSNKQSRGIQFQDRSKNIMISLFKSELTSQDVTGFKKWLQSNPVTIRYQLETPIEIPMTDEEIAQYDTYRKVIELNGVGDVADTLEILEDGSGIYTQNVSVYDSLGVCITKKDDNDIYVVEFGIPPLKGLDINKIMCNKLKTVRHNTFPNEEFITYSGYYVHVGIPKSKLKEQSARAVEEYFGTNGCKFMIPSKSPITTHIPKELMSQIILTYEKNNFSFGEGVKPSNATVALPTSDNVKKEYNTTLLNNYTQTVNTFAPYVSLMKDNKTVKIQMDLTSPGTGINGAIFALPAELRPKTNTKIIVFINGKSELAEIKASDGKVIAHVPSKNSNVYINTEYMRGLFNG